MQSKSTYGTHRLQIRGRLVLEVVGVLDPARRPNALVRRVVNHRCHPLALVRWVALRRALPWPAPRDFFALGIWHAWRDPVAILILIPILGLLRRRVRHHQRLVIQPVGWLLRLVVGTLVRRVLIPVIRLLGLRIGDLGLVNPVRRLCVLRIVDLLGRVEWRVEVFEQRSVLGRFAIDLDLEALVRLDDQRV